MSKTITLRLPEEEWTAILLLQSFSYRERGPGLKLGRARPQLRVHAHSSTQSGSWAAAPLHSPRWQYGPAAWRDASRWQQHRFGQGAVLGGGLHRLLKRGGALGGVFITGGWRCGGRRTAHCTIMA